MERRKSMKLIIRADDVGYTPVHNLGTFETIEHGVVTSADIMLDCPGTVDALEKLTKYPWISTGWHAHFWGAPVLDPKDVPTLYDPERKGFRKNLTRLEDVDFDEALAECRAELDRCVAILGKAPDVGGGMGGGNTPMSRAMQQVIAEYGMATNYMEPPEFIRKYIKDPSQIPVRDPKYPKIVSGSVAAFDDLETDSIKGITKYDPIAYYLEDKGGLLSMEEDAIVMNAWHPGYVDYFVYQEGDYGPNALNYIAIRTVDVHALTSPEVRNWIKEHKIELVNFRDALYGRREYQNHLRSVGSDLTV